MAIQTESRQEYQRKVKAQLDKLNAQLDELKAKADQAQAETRVRFHDQMEEIYTKRDATQAKFNELQQSGEAAWDDIRKGFEQAWTDLAQAFEKAAKSAKSAG